jgi:phosphoserine phosphatase
LIKLIAFDLDNVLIDGEALDEIGNLMGVKAEISKITKKAMEGDLDFETALKERVALLKGASADEVREVVYKIPLMEGALETVAKLKKRGYKVATITGSFEVIANRMKDELDLDYAFSNTLLEEDGKLTGEVSGPLVTGSKADVLKKIMEIENIPAEETAAVGDGANDISMLKEAGMGIAFNAKPVVKETADFVVDKRDLRELLTIFKGEKAEDEKTVETESPETEKTESKNPYAGKNFKELLKDKKELEKQLKGFTNERDELNAKAREHKQLRDDLNNSIKENLEKALKYRDERDSINKEVKEHKKLRDDANKKIKKVEWKSGRREIVQTQKEIEKLEKTIQTKVLDIKKENELVSKATDLRKELKGMHEDEKAQIESQKLNEVSEAEHAQVVELSDKAQETHENMIEYFRKIDEIRVKADDAHKKFIETRKEASKKHESVKSTFSEIKKVNKCLDKIKSKERGSEYEANKKRNRAEKEIAQDLFNRFKQGKKLSTDELRLLQKHKIV